MSDLNELSVAALRALAKEKGLKGISSLRKSELVQVLLNAENTADKKEEEDTSKTIVTPTKAISKTLQQTRAEADNAEPEATAEIQNNREEDKETDSDSLRQNNQRNNEAQSGTNRRQNNKRQNNDGQLNNDRRQNKNGQNNDGQQRNNDRRQNNNGQNNEGQQQNNGRRQNNNGQNNDGQQQNNGRRQNNNRQNNDGQQQNNDGQLNNNRRQNNNRQNNDGRQQYNERRQNNNRQNNDEQQQYNDRRQNNNRQNNDEQQQYNDRRQNNNRQNNDEQQQYNDRRQNNNRQNNDEQQQYNDRRQNNNYQNNDEQQQYNDRRQNNNHQNNDEQLNNDRRQNNSRQNYDDQSNNNRNNYQNRNQRTPMSQERMDSLDSGEVAKGILDINLEGGYGFIRGENYLTCENDIYVANTQIRRFNLKTGDYLEGPIRVSQGNEKFQALLYISKINGEDPENARKRVPFEKLTPIFADERLNLETENCSNAMRIMNLFAPIGKGQRGMIVSPPKAGKTTLLKDVANAVKTNHPEVHIIILLIDERPEEVTDIKESIQGDNVEVIHSTFDELPSHHVHVAEMVLDRGRRLVEQGQDCMILLDSITRLTRAYNLTVSASGRTLSGGLDPAALHMPKKFFGAARNIRNGGSLTILATALVDTGSRMDDVVFEEFKGTGNMEIVLDRKMSERRVFPAIDLLKSGTRRDDLLLNEAEQEAMTNIRRQLITLNPEEITERILQTMERVKSNEELVEMLRKMKTKPASNRNVATVMHEQNRTLK